QRGERLLPHDRRNLARSAVPGREPGQRCPARLGMMSWSRPAINIETTNALGLTMPPSVLAGADELVQWDQMPRYVVMLQAKGPWFDRGLPWLIVERTWSLLGPRKTILAGYKTEDEIQPSVLRGNRVGE